MLPSEIGERAEAAILAALAGAGKPILIPFGPRRYDLAYEEDGRLLKVQCKTGKVRKGAIHFPTSSADRHFIRRDYREDVDFFGVYCHSRREVYLVPVEDVPVRAATLRIEPSLNGQRQGIRPAAPYLLSRDSQVIESHPSMSPSEAPSTPELPGLDSLY
jgi:hypothetical protein